MRCSEEISLDSLASPTTATFPKHAEHPGTRKSQGGDVVNHPQAISKLRFWCSRVVLLCVFMRA